MKTLKLFNRFVTFVMVLTALGFISCSKEEEPEAEEQPTEDVGGRRLVSKMEFASEDGEEDFTMQLFYNEDGSLNRAMNDVDELQEMAFTHTGNKLTIKLDYGEEGFDTQTCTLNEDGYVTSTIYEGEDRNTYKYQNGFLHSGRFSEQINWNATWQNGDLVKTVMTDHTIKCTYTDKDNKMNIELLDFAYLDMFEDCELCMTSGYWGGKNKHLLRKVESLMPNNSGSSTEFSYEFDAEGYVTKIFNVSKEWGSGGDVWTWSYTISITYGK